MLDEKMECDAKMQVLKELRDMAIEMMGEKLPGRKEGLKEVTVAAPDRKGLEKGLEMASSLASESPDMEMAEGEEMGHDEDMDLEEIEAQIRELEDLRRAKLMKA